MSAELLWEVSDVQGQITMPPELVRSIDSLGDAIERSAPLSALRAAQTALDADAQACALLDDLTTAELEVRRMQTEGALTKEPIDRYRAARERATFHPAIISFAQAQQDATASLPGVNESISQLLGWDFAQMAAPAGGCC
jgi:cell fate (sporulation/competence/biofilm development) regulator YlbF (YheA/YmcA/DUF963 family)